MVYLAGDNNLAEEMVYALKSMELVGSNPPSYKVFALYDAGLGPVTLEIPKQGSKVLGLLQQAEDRRRKEGAQKAAAAKAVVEKLATKLDESTANLKKLEKLKLPTPPLTLKKGKPSVAEASGSIDHEVAAILEKSRIREAEEQDFAQELLNQAEDEKRVVQANQEALDQLAAATDLEKATNAVEKIKPETNLPVQSTLIDFVRKTITDNPANKYMLVLSGHGSGAVEDFLGGNRELSGLTIPELGESLKELQDEFQDLKFQVKGEKTEQSYLEHKKIIAIL